MITPDELRVYVTALQQAGITGKAKIGDIEITIPPLVVASGEAPKPKRSAKKEYDDMLFACTEGIRDEDEAQS